MPFLMLEPDEIKALSHDIERLHQSMQNRKIYQFYTFNFQNHSHQSS